MYDRNDDSLTCGFHIIWKPSAPSLFSALHGWRNLFHRPSPTNPLTTYPDPRSWPLVDDLKGFEDIFGDVIQKLDGLVFFCLACGAWGMGGTMGKP